MTEPCTCPACVRRREKQNAKRRGRPRADMQRLRARRSAQAPDDRDIPGARPAG